ncbi:MAG: DHHA1 domain-containing protein, partial [Chloroflexota bacterium]|nr:DHHA1 domain-containing protein [Chloroflexota bacterium]
VEAARILVEGRSGVGPILVRDDEWPAGIIGLVAGRLADSLARPVGAVTRVGDELRGSIRSPADFHVGVALEACASHLAKRGGHAAAGGFSVEPGRWEAFRAAFEGLTRPLGAADQELALPGRIAVDLVLPAVYLGWELSDQLERLAPYGPGHPEPILAVTGLRVGDARRVGVDGGHVAFRLRRSLETFDAVAFGTPPDRPLPEEGVALDVIGTLERDSFQGVPRLRLRVVDYADAEVSPLVGRRRAALQRAPLAVAG